MPINLLK